MPVAARAQTIPTPSSVVDDMIALLTPIPHSTKNPLLSPGRDYRGIAVEDWMFYPTVLAGATYDDNLVWMSRKPIAAAGFRINPSFVAVRDAGIHKTTVYGEVDGRLYPSLPRGDLASGQAGLVHVWEIQRDFTFKISGGFERKAQHIGGDVTTIPGGGVISSTMPLEYNRFQGAMALNKSFGKMFIGVGAETAKTDYDSTKTLNGRTSQSYRDSWINSLSVRGGFWFSPVMYAFTETTGNIREYNDSANFSRGYRTVAGLGSDRISLFRGEIFGGIQRQFYDNHLVKSVDSPVYGGKVFWFPTRDLTIRATLDQTLSDSRHVTLANPAGYPEKITSAQLNITYQIARDWQASVRMGYSHSAFVGTIRRDNSWKSGLVLFHELSRSVGITLDYDFERVISNVNAAGYSRNVVTLGIKYRY